MYFNKTYVATYVPHDHLPQSSPLPLQEHTTILKARNKILQALIGFIKSTTYEYEDKSRCKLNEDDVDNIVPMILGNSWGKIENKLLTKTDQTNPTKIRSLISCPYYSKPHLFFDMPPFVKGLVRIWKQI